MTRDRDISVTYIPALVDAIPREKQDGFVMQSHDYDLAVRVLPFDSLESLTSGKTMAALQREYNVVSEGARLQLIALLTLTQAIRTRDLAHLKTYLNLKVAEEMGGFKRQQEKLRKSLRGWPDLTMLRERDEIRRRRTAIATRIRHPLTELGRQLNEAVKKVRFVIWWNERKRSFEPGLYCENVATALAVLVFTRITSPRTLAVCQRAGCGKRFIRTKQSQKYCSLRCGNAARKARERAKRKER
jgi:CGNR zinc finger